MGVRPNMSHMSALGVLNVRPRGDICDTIRQVIHRQIYVDYVLVGAVSTCLADGFEDTLGFEFADDASCVADGCACLECDGCDGGPCGVAFVFVHVVGEYDEDEFVHAVDPIRMNDLFDKFEAHTR